jgi:hypothetical protein
MSKQEWTIQSPGFDEISARVMPLVLIMVCKAQADGGVEEGLADKTVELLIHTIEHVMRIALQHGAPTDPAWWDCVGDELSHFSDWLDKTPPDDERGVVFNEQIRH